MCVCACLLVLLLLFVSIFSSFFHSLPRSLRWSATTHTNTQQGTRTYTHTYSKHARTRVTSVLFVVVGCVDGRRRRFRPLGTRRLDSSQPHLTLTHARGRTQNKNKLARTFRSPCVPRSFTPLSSPLSSLLDPHLLSSPRSTRWRVAAPLCSSLLRRRRHSHAATRPYDTYKTT